PGPDPGRVGPRGGGGGRDAAERPPVDGPREPVSPQPDRPAPTPQPEGPGRTGRLLRARQLLGDGPVDRLGPLGPGGPGGGPIAEASGRPGLAGPARLGRPLRGGGGGGRLSAPPPRGAGGG